MGWQRGVAAAAGLDGGLFVGGDDELVVAQRLSVPGAGVQIEHLLGFGGEVGVAEEDPGLVLPRFEGVLGQQAAHRRRRYRGADPFGDGVAGQFRGAPPRQRYTTILRWLTRQCLEPGDLYRGEPGRAPRPFRIPQRRQPWTAPPPVTPLADGVDPCPDPYRDHRVGISLCGQQHDPHPGHQPLRGRARPGQALQLLLLGIGQHDHIGAGHRHRGVLHGEVSAVTSASPLTTPALVSDTPIRHDEFPWRPHRNRQKRPCGSV